ncbi:hypothetical protein NTGBS_310013 [Candidatus Nitrotoga sp. BS]|nr:hypothetical protein NTGBS_310013 [Candidatus Nitrotoga sp. BS]
MGTSHQYARLNKSHKIDWLGDQKSKGLYVYTQPDKDSTPDCNLQGIAAIL